MFPKSNYSINFDKHNINIFESLFCLLSKIKMSTDGYSRILDTVLPSNALISKVF